MRSYALLLALSSACAVEPTRQSVESHLLFMKFDGVEGQSDDRSVRAIVALRGGYGTPRLLDKVDYRALRRDPKILVGYSDLTALLLAVYRKTGLVTFSGPMAGVEMWKSIDPLTGAKSGMRTLAEGEKTSVKGSGMVVLQGKFRGPGTP